MTIYTFRTCTVALPNDVQSARDVIKGLGKKFNGLRDFIRECIEGKNIAVEEVATVIKLISPDNDDASRKMFQDSCVTVIGTATNHSELFGTINFHWNYLDPSLYTGSCFGKVGFGGSKGRNGSLQVRFRGVQEKDTPNCIL